MILLIVSFFFTALIYAAVGFGGGSTYNAVLILAGFGYRTLPIISLFCNIIVTLGGSLRFIQNGYVQLKRVLPWIITSIPAAWVGGSIHISETIFTGLLGFSLCLAGLRMLWDVYHLHSENNGLIKAQNSFVYGTVVGAILGFLSGLVGIGGGIFLAPVLHLLRWDTPKVIAGTCSIFILVNSIAGLLGQFSKMAGTEIFNQVTPYWFLFGAVILGGQIGSYLVTVKLKQNTIRIGTAVLIFYAAFKLLSKWWQHF